jgi:uncharacterized membrane protein YkgB
MEILKKILKRLRTALVVLSFGYLVISLCNWTLNMSNWGGLSLFIMCIFVTLSFMITEIEIPLKNNRKIIL